MDINGMVAQANELPDGLHIATPGMASVDTMPDIVTLTIEASTVAGNAAIAKKQADKCVAQYISFLEPNQIAKKDISSTGLRTQPDYNYQDGGSILKGYRAVRTVEVTLRQLDKLNSLLDGALKAGPNEIRPVSLDVAQPDTYKDKAREAVTNNTIHQVQELANDFHRKLGPVYSVRYHVSDYQPSPMVRMIRADATPVPTREAYGQAVIQFDDQADITFRLEPVDQPSVKTPIVYQYLQPNIFVGLMPLPDTTSSFCRATT